MNYYLVDFENVQKDGTKSISNIEKRSTLILFYTEQCKNISIDIMECVARKALTFFSYKVNTGTKNALDFQLSSYLGYLIKEGGSQSSYFIISNDKGYDCLCKFWKERGISVKRISSIGASSLIEESIDENTTTIKEIRNILSESDLPEEVLLIVNQYDTKQAICNGIAKIFKDSKRTGLVYKRLKPLLVAKKKK